MSAEEACALAGAVDELRAGGSSPAGPDFYDRHPSSHELLPAGLSRFLDEFRRDGNVPVCEVRGFPVDDAAVGPTPDHWDLRDGLESTAELDIAVAMCASALGEPFAWATLQCGRLVQDVFPIRGDERRESGHGSDAFLQFHTDDAFRPDSCDYILLFGVRNHDAVPTYVSAVRDVELGDDDRRVLSEARFHIIPDDEHIRQLELRAPGDPALRKAIEMRDRPAPVPVLFGNPFEPCIRLDAPYMSCVGDDPAARRALDALAAELHRVRRPLVAAQGTLLILNNRSVAHARESFTARYDGTDRWLRKIIVSRDPGEVRKPVSADRVRL
ncbi:TauD/TfdA family dioxygenase [Actinoplanes digitatis]|nr:TauD/TfdA family dioxygenase [Actinoplanes digitatis]